MGGDFVPILPLSNRGSERLMGFPMTTRIVSVRAVVIGGLHRKNSSVATEIGVSLFPLGAWGLLLSIS